MRTLRQLLCFNVVDSRFASFCSPTQVETLTLKKPKEAAPKDAIQAAIRDAVEAKFVDLGACVGGACTSPRASVGSLCTMNADCDVQGGDGVCRGRFGALLDVITDTNVCTRYMDIVVPLKQPGSAYSAGKQTLDLLVEPTPDPVTGKLRKGDNDKLKLVCLPPP